MIADAVASAVLNNLLFAGIPFSFYWLFHRIRRRRTLPEVARRAGLQRASRRSLAHSALMALLIVVALLVWPPPLEPMTRPGAAYEHFEGLGLDATSVVLALLYGVFRTGLPEELLFRGLIAGSLFRRLPLCWANAVQALTFLLPHLLLLKVMPEAWPMMPLIFVGALWVGWLRFDSGSIVGPWIVHATANVATCLSIAVRSAA